MESSIRCNLHLVNFDYKSLSISPDITVWLCTFPYVCVCVLASVDMGIQYHATMPL